MCVWKYSHITKNKDNKNAEEEKKEKWEGNAKETEQAWPMKEGGKEGGKKERIEYIRA